MRNLFLLLVTSFTLYSCDKSINGRIIDNFNKPVENVEIKITNSGYESKSDNKGKFKIDYAAGKFKIVFKNHNYIDVEKELEINEQKNYPLGQIEMIRIPDSTGLYFKGNDDFIQIPKITLVPAKKVLYSMLTGYVDQISYYLPKVSIKEILIDSIKAVEFYNFLDLPVILLLSDNGSVAIQSQGPTYLSKVNGIQVSETITNLIGNATISMFTPQLDKTYVYINFKDEYGFQRMSNTAFAFKFVLKKKE
jgi:hypothetical protein